MTFKDWFKSKPYWLKGGIIFVIWYIISYFLMSITQAQIYGDIGSFAFIFPYIVVMGTLNSIFGRNSIFDTGDFFGGAGNATLTGYMIGGIITLFLVFLIGALCGWLIGFIIEIIGKIKSKE